MASIFAIVVASIAAVAIVVAAYYAITAIFNSPPPPPPPPPIVLPFGNDAYLNALLFKENIPLYPVTSMEYQALTGDMYLTTTDFSYPNINKTAKIAPGSESTTIIGLDNYNTNMFVISTKPWFLKRMTGSLSTWMGSYTEKYFEGARDGPGLFENVQQSSNLYIHLRDGFASSNRITDMSNMFRRDYFGGSPNNYFVFIQLSGTDLDPNTGRYTPGDFGTGSGVRTMAEMFWGQGEVRFLGFGPGFASSPVLTDMRAMFHLCFKIEGLTLPPGAGRYATDMSRMFESLTNHFTLDPVRATFVFSLPENFGLAAENIEDMFKQFGYIELTLPSGFGTSASLANAKGAFRNTLYLKTLRMNAGFATGNTTADLSNMFSITSITDFYMEAHTEPFRWADAGLPDGTGETIHAPSGTNLSSEPWLSYAGLGFTVIDT